MQTHRQYRAWKLWVCLLAVERLRRENTLLDAFTVFLAGKHTGVGLAGDLIEQVSSGVMNNHRAVLYRPMWGKTLPILVSQAKTAVEELWAGIRQPLSTVRAECNYNCILP